MDLAVAGGLEPEQFGVKPAAGHELLVGPILYQLAVLEDENAVRHAHGREAV